MRFKPDNPSITPKATPPRTSVRGGLVKEIMQLFARSSIILAFGLLANVHAQQAVNPFTYLGRVTDATHAAFDTNRVATLYAYDASGHLLAKSTTFFHPDSRNNFRLQIPLSSPAVTGYSAPGAILTITVDDGAKVWTGVLVDPGRASGTAVGEPGGVREVNIVLGEDANGDGIDDTLRQRLEQEWEDSDFWDPDAGFDPNADHDGDGVSTIDEAYAGTNPFNASDVLRITAFAVNAAPAGTNMLHSLVFPTTVGRAYSIRTANALEGPWTDAAFFLAPSDAAPVNVIAIPSVADAAVRTVYLLPAPDKDAAFFRVRAE